MFVLRKPTDSTQLLQHIVKVKVHGMGVKPSEAKNNICLSTAQQLIRPLQKEKLLWQGSGYTGYSKCRRTYPN